MSEEKKMKKIEMKEVTVNVERYTREVDQERYDKNPEMFEHMRDKQLEDNIFNLVDALGNLVNVMGSDYHKKFAEFFAQALRRQHNTLEQSLIINLLNALFMRFSPLNEHKWVDLRNQSACDTVNKIRELLKKDEYCMYYKGNNDDEDMLHAPLI